MQNRVSSYIYGAQQVNPVVLFFVLSLFCVAFVLLHVRPNLVLLCFVVYVVLSFGIFLIKKNYDLLVILDVNFLMNIKSYFVLLDFLFLLINKAKSLKSITFIITMLRDVKRYIGCLLDTHRYTKLTCTYIFLVKK